MSGDELARLRAVCEAATPGPWRMTESGTHAGPAVVWGVHCDVVTSANALSDDEDDRLDFRAIAALVSLWPELLAVVEAQVIHLDDDGELCSQSGEPLRWRMCVCCGVEKDHEGYGPEECGPLPPFPHGVDCPVDALRAAIRERLGDGDE